MLQYTAYMQRGTTTCNAVRASNSVSRRHVIGLVLTSTLTGRTLVADADVLKDIAVQLVRPEDLAAVTAVVSLMDAKSVLRDVQVCWSFSCMAS